MLGPEAIIALMSAKGLWIVAPIAVLEGPIVTVIAAWLSSKGYFSPVWLTVVVVLADLVGDFIFYCLGRWGLGRIPEGWRRRLGLDRDRLELLASHYEHKGGRTLIFGKITHSAGFVVLAAAGLARMPVGAFLWYNLIATIPKSIAFVALGYYVGAAYTRIDGWIGKGALIMGGIIAVAAIMWIVKKTYSRKT